MPALVVQAQDRHKDNPPGYAEAIHQALVELEANNFPEAREEFRRAHAIFPNARTLRGIGMVEFELRNYAESVKLLEEALASRVKPLEGKLRAETESLLERARRYLGELIIRLEPREASLTVDGIKAQPEAGVLTLEVGQHVLEAQASGYARERRVVGVRGSARTEVSLSLRRLEPNAGPTAQAPARQPFNAPDGQRSDVQPAYKKWWVWTIVAVVAAGGATAAVLLLTRDKQGPPSAVMSPNTPGVSLHTLVRR